MQLIRHAALAALVITAIAATSHSYLNLAQAKIQSQAAWGEIAQTYAVRTVTAPKAIEIAGRESTVDPRIIESAREALARAAALPPQTSLIEDAQAIENFKRSQNEVTGSLFRLLGSTETIPHLRNNVSMVALNNQLRLAEIQLAEARERYRRSASNYNALTQAFPNVVTAKLFGYESVVTDL